MDGLSSARVARLLGTSVPRVLRAAERLGLDPQRTGRGTGSRVRFSEEQVEQLRADLGVQAAGALSLVQAKVLAALARSSRGVLSTRTLARRAGVSPTAATRAIGELQRRDLITRNPRRVTLGSVCEVEALRANMLSPEWPAVALQLANVRPPHHFRKPAKRVPNELRHLFWNTAESQLDVDHAGGYIARRLIQVGSLDGLAWGAENLRPEHWRHAAETRGLSPSLRALARNLAAQEKS